MSKLHQTLGEQLKSFGGHLECEKCGRIEPLENTSHYLRQGWPLCCGYTMRWFTEKELREREVSR